MKWTLPFLLLKLLLKASSEGIAHNVERQDMYTTTRPVVNSLAFYNTVNQQKMGHVSNGQRIDICNLGSAGIHSPSQLAFRAWTTDTKSVDFIWNSLSYRRENYEPFTLCGDSGEGAYHGCNDLKYGHHCISAKPWSLMDGQGVLGNTMTVCFDVVGCPAPVPAPTPPLSVTSFELINTVNQNTIRTLTQGETIDICNLGSVGIHSPSQLNFRAVTTGIVESVLFNKNSNFFRTDNVPFYSLCGDNGGFPYYGCSDLTFGYQCISAKPCTQDNASGVCGATTTTCFTIKGCPSPTRAPISPPVMPAPSVTSFELINTVNQNTIRTLTYGETIDICKLGSIGINSPSQLNFRAVTSGNVESVQFNKNSNFYRNDNAAFYSLCGDNAGFPYYGCTDLAFGYQCISAKACTQDNASGVCGAATTICLTIIGCPSPTRAPIKAPTKTPIGKPTYAPIRSPTNNPIGSPTRAPIRAPTKAPTRPPTKVPFRVPTKAPTSYPTRTPTEAPIRTPTKSPTRSPSKAPIRVPTKAPTRAPRSTPTSTPISSPTYSPINAPTRIPIGRPSSFPVTSPTRAPVSRPTFTPVRAPTTRPISVPSKVPVRPPTASPVETPITAPITTPANAPIHVPATPPVRSPLAAPVMPTPECSSLPLGAASLYSLFIFTHISGLRINQGNVAVGGNANLKNADVRIAGNLVVNGNLFTASGQVGGKVTIGGTNNIVPSFLVLGGVASGRPIDIIKEKPRLQVLSQTYATYILNGITSYADNDEIILTCNDSNGLSVFNVNGTRLSSTKAFTINVPIGSTVLINVDGTSYISISNFIITVNNTSPTKVLWNMPAVNNLHISTIDMQGSILAPNAVINYSNGSFVGTIIGNSWTGNGEGLASSFNGCIPLYD
jgi:choice-of-anchor A domain-containing protein